MRFKKAAVFLAVVVTLAGVSCCEQGKGENDDIAWGECPDLYFFQSFPSAECASVSVPLDYDDPKSEKIDVFVFRYRGKSNHKKGQVWFLKGGPGGAGTTLAPRMKDFVERYPDYDAYSLDHRGVGMSARVGCHGDNNYKLDLDKVENCLKEVKGNWGDKLAFFTTTNAARDVHSAVKLAREGDEKVFIYGVSYGTYWLMRYLQLYPDQVNGIILDSICSPGDCYLDRYDQWNNEAGQQFLAKCDSGPVCSEKMSTLGTSSFEALKLTFDKLEKGDLCDEISAMFNKDSLKHQLAVLQQNWSKRVLIPPLLYRMNRCSNTDVQAVANLLKKPEPDLSEELDYYVSPMLADHISLSELYGGATLEQAEDFASSAYFTEGESIRLVRLMTKGVWPTYRDTKYAQTFPETNLPILMINGAADPQTPPKITRKAEDYFKGNNQHFVLIPHATHGVMVFSPIDKPWPEGKEPCGMSLMGQFVDEPTGELDTSCVDEVCPLEFSGDSVNNQATSQASFGTTDMWEGSPSTGQ